MASGKSLMELADYVGAAEHFQIAVKLRKSPDSEFALAEALSKAGHSQFALEIFRGVLSQKDADVGLKARTARQMLSIYRNNSRIEEAIAMLEGLRNQHKEPEFEWTGKEISDLRSELTASKAELRARSQDHFRKGQELEATGDCGKAAEKFGLSLDECFDPETARRRGWCCERLGRYREAGQDYAACLKAFGAAEPKSAEVMFRLAICKYYTGEYEECIRGLRMAAERAEHFGLPELRADADCCLSLVDTRLKVFACSHLGRH